VYSTSWTKKASMCDLGVLIHYVSRLPEKRWKVRVVRDGIPILNAHSTDQSDTPVFNARCRVSIARAADPLRVEVWKANWITPDSFFGYCEVPLLRLLPQQFFAQPLVCGEAAADGPEVGLTLELLSISELLLDEDQRRASVKHEEDKCSLELDETFKRMTVAASRNGELNALRRNTALARENREEAEARRRVCLHESHECAAIASAYRGEITLARAEQWDRAKRARAAFDTLTLWHSEHEEARLRCRAVVTPFARVRDRLTVETAELGSRATLTRFLYADEFVAAHDRLAVESHESTARAQVAAEAFHALGGFGLAFARLLIALDSVEVALKHSTVKLAAVEATLRDKENTIIAMEARLLTSDTAVAELTAEVTTLHGKRSAAEARDSASSEIISRLHCEHSRLLMAHTSMVDERQVAARAVAATRRGYANSLHERDTTIQQLRGEARAQIARFKGLETVVAVLTRQHAMEIEDMRQQLPVQASIHNGQLTAEQVVEHDASAPHGTANYDRMWTVDVFPGRLGHHEIIMEFGDVYTGEVAEHPGRGVSVPHGRGTLQSGRGRHSYVGGFQYQQRHGWGKLITPAFVMWGAWKYNRPDLTSAFRLDLPDGSKYCGYVTALQSLTPSTPRPVSRFTQYVLSTSYAKAGWGEIVYPDGRRYFGQWSQDLATGYGCLLGTDGERYVGMWSAGVFHGAGVRFTNNDVVYDGTWAEGRFRCFDGKVIFARQIRLRGNWDDVDCFKNATVMLPDRRQAELPFLITSHFDHLMLTAAGAVCPKKIVAVDEPLRAVIERVAAATAEQINEIFAAHLKENAIFTRALKIFQQLFYFVYGACGSSALDGCCALRSLGGCMHRPTTRRLNDHKLVFDALGDILSFVTSSHRWFVRHLGPERGIDNLNGNRVLLRHILDSVLELVHPPLMKLYQDAYAAEQLALDASRDRLRAMPVDHLPNSPRARTYDQALNTLQELMTSNTFSAKLTNLVRWCNDIDDAMRLDGAETNWLPSTSSSLDERAPIPQYLLIQAEASDLAAHARMIAHFADVDWLLDPTSRESSCVANFKACVARLATTQQHAIRESTESTAPILAGDRRAQDSISVDTTSGEEDGAASPCGPRLPHDEPASRRTDAPTLSASTMIYPISEYSPSTSPREESVASATVAWSIPGTYTEVPPPECWLRPERRPWLQMLSPPLDTLAESLCVVCSKSVRFQELVRCHVCHRSTHARCAKEKSLYDPDGNLTQCHVCCACAARIHTQELEHRRRCCRAVLERYRAQAANTCVGSTAPDRRLVSAPPPRERPANRSRQRLRWQELSCTLRNVAA
jgi:hypothetical protein